MSTEPIPLSEIIAEMSEEDQAWVERQSAQWIAEEYARRAADGKSGEPQAVGEPQPDAAGYRADADQSPQGASDGRPHSRAR